LKALFYIAVILAAAFLIDLLIKIVRDFSRLTQYGWGYLAGRAVLIVLFTGLAVFAFKKTYGKKSY
jgi:hypothetical protein